MMRVLGVVLAGGQSRRFGSDKALAEIAGRTLLDRAVATLARQVDTVVVAGRFHSRPFRHSIPSDERQGGRRKRRPKGDQQI